MRQAIITYLPWLLSLITIAHSWLIGNKDIRGWVLGLCNQAGWVIWIVASGTWGFVPLNLMLWIIYIRNYRAWSRG